MVRGIIVILFAVRKKFFRFLIMLEILVFSAFMMMGVLSLGGRNLFYLFILVIFLCFAVAEAVLGLSILVASSRTIFFYRQNSFSLMRF